ncbi:MAG TPA: helix-turn-helix domain-containing protein [Bacteroidales bacterium]|nr:helix-turn-helix domain-containing protein [Bacteroidales bacterium]
MEKNFNGKDVKTNDSTGKENFETNQLIKILTIQEVADLLRIHRSTVTRLAKSGEIRSYKLGNRRLFKDVDVFAFFENQVDRGYVFGKEL